MMHVSPLEEREVRAGNWASLCPGPCRWPCTSSPRDELLEAEIALRLQIEAVAAERRRLPLGGALPTDYAFEEWDAGACAARTVRLSELFENGEDTLYIYSFMFNPGVTERPLEVACPMCTSMLTVSRSYHAALTAPTLSNTRVTRTRG